MTLMMSLMGVGVAIPELGDQKEGIKAVSRILSCINDAALSPIDGLTPAGVIPTDPQHPQQRPSQQREEA